MDHHGPGVRGVAGLDAAQEGQEGGGVLGHAVVRPGRELELADLPLLVGATLEVREVRGHSVRDGVAWGSLGGFTGALLWLHYCYTTITIALLSALNLYPTNLMLLLAFYHYQIQQIHYCSSNLLLSNRYIIV